MNTTFRRAQHFLRRSFAIAITALLFTFGMNSNLSAAIILGFTFSNVGDASIAFDGASNFTFADSTTAAAGFDFEISGETGAATSLVGLQGNIGGIFAIGSGAISASVSGLGTFSIFDGVSDTLTGTIDMIDITSAGVFGLVNMGGFVNLDTISYTGSNPDLLFLASDPFDASVVFSFSFVPAKTLEMLRTEVASTAYEGTLSAIRTPSGILPVPEPASLAIWSLGALGMMALRMRRRKLAI